MQALRAAQIAQSIAKDCVVTRLRKLSRSITRLYDEALRPLGLKASQQAVLVAIGAEPDSRIGDIAERLELAPSSMTRSVTALAEQGWVEVESEGREARVNLTSEGKQILLASQKLWLIAQRQVAGELEKSGLLADLNDAVHRAKDVL